MKVLHINLNFNVSSLYKNLTESLIENGCNTTVYYPVRKNYVDYNEEHYLNVSPCLGKYDRLFFQYRNKKILKDIQNLYHLKDFEVLHAHSLFSNGHVAYDIKKKYGIPYIVAVRNTDMNVFFKKIVHMRKKGIKILEEAEKIIFLSKPYKNMLLNNYVPKNIRNQIEEKIEIIPNGINSFWHSNKHESRSITPDSKALNIISVGIINKGKNALTTVNACKKMKETKGIDVKLTLVGEVSDKHYFNKIMEHDFVSHVSYQPKEKLIQMYRESDLFIMPSLRETFGLVYAEAMSQGLPIIYTEGQGFDQQFEDGIVGYSVDCNDELDIIDKIELILKNYENITSNCIKLVDKFTWDRISKEYINIYNNL